MPALYACTNPNPLCSYPVEENVVVVYMLLLGKGYAIALPISSLDISYNLGRDLGLGESPPDGTPSKKSDIPGELLPLSVFIWLLVTSSSMSYHVDCRSLPFRSLLLRSLPLHMLFVLMLLLRLFERACPGGAFDNRELCRFGGVMNGSAPGMVSSVRPARAFGALATTEWNSDSLADIVLIDVGEAAHVQAGEYIGSEVIGFISSRFGGVLGSFSRSLFRHDSISSSFIGDAPRCPKGACPRLKRRQRKIAPAIRRSPTNPRTVDRMMTSV